ncbi:MAG: DUF368 domain-containing protein [Chromatiaceae bacterium]|nr:DUF368 domain-containing protein [Chromatiaceae bacterium]
MSHLALVFKGAAMGIAEVIPGVSGGTIAFVSGLYERLIDAVSAFGPGLLGVARREGPLGVWRAVDGGFLALLLSGMMLGLLVGVFSIGWLLEQYPPLVWAFFFGLILASILHMGRRIGGWSAGRILAFALGAGAAYTLTLLTPSEGGEALWFVFLCGAIAISALMLPGISGSFMLLLLGMYEFIIHDSLKGLLVDFTPERLLVVAVFALGCLAGLMSVTRLLHWTLHRFHGLTLATLTGFLLGSLNRIWPWRNADAWLFDAEGAPLKVLHESNVWPSDYAGDPLVMGVLVALALGVTALWLLERGANGKGARPEPAPRLQPLDNECG